MDEDLSLYPTTTGTFKVADEAERVWDVHVTVQLKEGLPHRVFVRGDCADRNNVKGNHSPLDGVDLLFTLTSMLFQKGGDPTSVLRQIAMVRDGPGLCIPTRFPWEAFPNGHPLTPEPLVSLVARFVLHHIRHRQQP